MSNVSASQHLLINSSKKSMSLFVLSLFLFFISTQAAFATANYVYHERTTNNPGCGGLYVSNLTPGSADAVTLRFKVEYQYYTDNARIYYTTDGSNPSGAFGTASGTTQVVNASWVCLFNAGQNVDVWEATIPAQQGGKTIKYIISAWHSGGGSEIFANSGEFINPKTTSAQATQFSYTVTCPTISFNQTTLSNGTVGTLYNHFFTVSGGTPSHTFVVASGSLPAGLTLMPGGSLDGTPTTAGTYNFTVTATDANGCTGNKAYSIVVNEPPLAVKSITPSKNAFNISKSTNITVVFNKAMNTSTLIASNIVIGGPLSGRHFGTITLLGDTGFVFNPDEDFEDAEHIAISLTGNIRSGTGEYLTNGYQSLFTVQAQTGTGGFVLNNLYPMNTGMQGITSGDWDNDGDVDLAAPVNSSDHRLYIMYNDGTGHFFKQETLYVASSLWRARSGDVDNDGDLDIVGDCNTYYGSAGESFIYTFVNDGAGNFSVAPYTVSDVAGPLQFELGDLDGDGDLDMLVPSGNTNTVYVVKNNGSGIFSKYSHIGLIGFGIVGDAVSLYDFDADGDLDGVVGNSNQAFVRFLYNDGQGNFSQDTLTLPGLHNFPTLVNAGDFNGDGIGEVLVGGFFAGYNAILNNDGNGNFTFGYDLSSGGNKAIITDVEGDGDLDIVPTFGNYEVRVYKNDGSGSFPNTALYGHGGADPFGFTYGDFDGDGDPDFATGNYSSSNVSVVFNDYGCPSIALDPPLSVPNSSENASYSQTFTVTGSVESFNFIISSGTLPPGLSLSSGGVLSGTTTTLGTYTFTVTAVRGNGCSASKTYTIVVGEPPIAVESTTPSKNALNVSVTSNVNIEFNKAINTGTITSNTFVVEGSYSGRYNGSFSFSGDTLVSFDPVIEFRKGEQIHVRLAKNIKSASGDSLLAGYRFSFTVQAIGGTGSFTHTQNITTGTSSVGGTSADLDNDGDIDLIAGTSGIDSFTVMLNNGSGGFTSYRLKGELGQERHTIVGDFDGDGDLDFIAAMSQSYNYNQLVTFYNDGTGNFPTRTPSQTTNISYTNLTAGDFDGDMDLDLAVYASTYTQPRVCFLKNNGSGIFTEILAITMWWGSYDNPGNIANFDYDADGDLDVLCGNGYGDYLGVFINDGTGNFSSFPMYRGNAPKSIYNADFDNDGDIDLGVLHTPYFRWLEILKNNGYGVYTRTDSITGSATFSVGGMADVDGDGDIDFTAIDENNRFEVLKNNGTGTFTQTQSFLYGGLDASIAGELPVGDFDGDGDMDAATMNYSSPNVSILLNNFSCPTITVNPSSLPNGTTSTSYNQTISASGGTPAYSFAVTSGSLPAGLSLSSAGGLTGTPTSTGTSYFTITATDLNGCTGARSCTLIVQAPVFGSISGMKWHDVDADGIKDENEPGISDWTVFIDSNNNGLLDGGEVSAVTDSAGNYSFGSLSAGTYRIREVMQAEWTRTSVLAESTIVASGQAINDVNFGNYKYGTIGGRKWNDLNNNSDREESEPLIPGWQMVMWDVNNPTIKDTVTTDSTGWYWFTSLMPGIYHIIEVQQSPWVQTFPHTYEQQGYHLVGVTSGTYSIGNDFGNHYNPPVGSISGMKWNDVDGDGVKDEGEPPLQGWVIVLNGDAVFDTTDADGNYSFENLSEGTFTVTEQQQVGWTQTSPPNGNYEVALNAGENATGKDFGNFRFGEIRGRKWNDLNNNSDREENEPLISGWKIVLYEVNQPTIKDTVLTDSTGWYTFKNLLPGTYHIIEVQQSQWVQTFPHTYEQQGYHLVGVTSGTYSEGNDFGNHQIGSISGMKFNDVNSNGTKDEGENGLQGWTIQLYTSIASGAVPILTSTDANGNYSFDSLSAGDYLLSEQQQAGWNQTFPPGGSYSVTLNAGENLTGKDFGNHFVVLGSISGMKFNDMNGNGSKDDGESGLQGWSMNLQLNIASPPPPIVTTTDANGNYTFSNLHAGNYTVSETQQSGWTQTFPVGGSYTFNLASEQHVTGKDFGNAHFSFISGKKFNDYDGDGMKDAGEPGQQGWIIQATKDAATKLDTTDANGNYLFRFTEQETGTWTVSEVNQNGWIQTMPASGTYSVNVTAGSNAVNQDFGNFKSPTISGLKWRDDNGNGVKDGSEGVLANWIIKAMKDASAKFDTTDANGLYSFSFGQTETGTWTVSEVQQSSWTQTFPLTGTHTISVRSALDTTNINFGNAQYGSISGKKYEDVAGDSVTSGDPTLNGWVIQLYNGEALLASDTTSGSGDYQFNSVAPGTYTVQEVLQSGWIQTYPTTASHSVTVTSGSNVSGKDFANFKLGSISGTKYQDTDGDSTIDAGEPTLPNRLIQLWKGQNLVVEDSSDANGNYSFVGLSAGTYDVSEVQPSADWYRTIPSTVTYTLSITSGSVYTGKDFANVQFGTVSGYKFRDYDSTGTFNEVCEEYLAGQKIVLVGSHTAPETTVTDANGNFTFDPVPADVYTLKEAGDALWRQTKPANGTPYSFQLLSNVDTSGFVFGNFFILDTGKFRTFTINEYNKAAGAKQKSGFAKKPTGGNVRDSVHVKRGFDSPTGYMLVGVPQSNPDSQLVYGWYYYKLDATHPYKPSAAKSWLYNPSAVRIVTYPRLPGKPKLPKKPTDYITAYGENVAESEIGNALNYGQAHFISFKTNIAASDLGITPPGYGELVYGCVKNADFSDSVLVGKTLREISHFYDTVLTLGRLIRNTGDTVYRYPKFYLRLLDSVVVRLNNEFTSTKVDTYSTKPLAVRGAKSLYKASYLHSVPEVAVRLQRYDEQFGESEVQPVAYRLEQNYPNPFNPVTVIGYQLSVNSTVNLKIYNLLGQEVATLLNNEIHDEGYHEIEFDATMFPSGVYFYRIEAKGKDVGGLHRGFSDVGKMLLIK
ncbi:MAG: VCBS repeat-containing protein [Ignavibacteriae bacterium]|nr:VCBS repeat-containing protein [Ignavibacteriota bacterium]